MQRMANEDVADYKKKLLETCKKYNRIDYDDDEDIIEMMIDVAIEEMTELIPNFNPEAMTQRQRLLVVVSVKDLYDNREKYGKDVKHMKNAVSSMLLKEIYGGGK